MDKEIYVYVVLDLESGEVAVVSDRFFSIMERDAHTTEHYADGTVALLDQGWAESTAWYMGESPYDALIKRTQLFPFWEE